MRGKKVGLGGTLKFLPKFYQSPIDVDLMRKYQVHF
jgi:hypothetical protein